MFSERIYTTFRATKSLGNFHSTKFTTAVFAFLIVKRGAIIVSLCHNLPCIELMGLVPCV